MTIQKKNNNLQVLILVQMKLFDALYKVCILCSLNIVGLI